MRPSPSRRVSPRRPLPPARTSQPTTIPSAPTRVRSVSWIDTTAPRARGVPSDGCESAAARSASASRSKPRLVNAVHSSAPTRAATMAAA